MQTRFKSTVTICVSLAILYFVIACSSFGKIEVRHDEFKNASIVTLKLEHTSEETFDLLGLASYKAEMEYVREVGSETESPLQIALLIRAAADAAPLAQQGFLKAGQTKYELALQGAGHQLKSQTTSKTRTTNYHSPDASGFVDFTKPTAVDSKTQTSTQSWRELTAAISLTNDQKQGILNADSLLLRVYSGTNPITFRIVGDDLNKIQEMIRTDPKTHPGNS